MAADELFETACILIETYITDNLDQYIHPHFHCSVVKDVTNLLEKTLDTSAADVADSADTDSADAGTSTADTSTADTSTADIDTDTLTYIVEKGMEVFYRHISPARSSGNTFIRYSKPNIQKLREKINYLINVPQPVQRTPAWYEFRYKHLTASNIWKTFISESTRNQLIFEKCQPLSTTEKYSGPPSLESPMHWGQKYEPLSVMLYEKIYQTKVSDFGCIPHKTIEFLAASPDGINTLETSARYGRMLEVKNIVNRDITGMPKMEYWIQMQVQMEVCDLNECDFLETRFTEYPDFESYTNAVDANAVDANANAVDANANAVDANANAVDANANAVDANANAVDANANAYKGIMMLFMKGNGQPLYEYAPLDLSVEDTALWQEEMMEKNKEMNWLKNIYWKLDEISCVFVLRNKRWFQDAALPQLKAIWQTIETEKTAGYSHRAPKKNSGIRVKKFSTTTENIEMNSTCFITIDTTNM